MKMQRIMIETRKNTSSIEVITKKSCDIHILQYLFLFYNNLCLSFFLNEKYSNSISIE